MSTFNPFNRPYRGLDKAIPDSDWCAEPYTEGAGVPPLMFYRVEKMKADHRAMVKRAEAIRAEEEKAAAGSARVAAVIGGDTEQIGDFYDEIMEASGLDTDHRWTQWVREITEVDPAPKDGYMFVGDFLKRGTIQLSIKPRLYLVAAESGSRKNKVTYYQLVRMNADSTYTAIPGAETTSATGGWALRMKKHVIAALKELSEGS